MKEEPGEAENKSEEKTETLKTECPQGVFLVPKATWMREKFGLWV